MEILEPHVDPSSPASRAQAEHHLGQEQQEFMRPILEKYEREGSPSCSTARRRDDGVIDPGRTLDVLALALSATSNAPIPETTFVVCRM